MYRRYADILSRIPEPPVWFDEHAVPRWCAPIASNAANVYARWCCFFIVACQECGHKFLVCNTGDIMEMEEPSYDRITLWGDPPNIGCCSAGPTMTADFVKVVSFSTRGPTNMSWVDAPLPYKERPTPPDQ